MSKPAGVSVTPRPSKSSITLVDSARCDTPGERSASPATRTLAVKRVETSVVRGSTPSRSVAPMLTLSLPSPAATLSQSAESTCTDSTCATLAFKHVTRMRKPPTPAASKVCANVSSIAWPGRVGATGARTTTLPASGVGAAGAWIVAVPTGTHGDGAAAVLCTQARAVTASLVPAGSSDSHVAGTVQLDVLQIPSAEEVNVQVQLCATACPLWTSSGASCGPASS